MYKTNGRPNGHATMDFKTVEGAEKAIRTMTHHQLGDRQLIVREVTDQDRERLAQMESDDPAAGGKTEVEPSGWGVATVPHDPSADAPPNISPPVLALASVTPAMLEQAGFPGPITNTLYITGVRLVHCVTTHLLLGISPFHRNTLGDGFVGREPAGCSSFPTKATIHNLINPSLYDLYT